MTNIVNLRARLTRYLKTLFKRGQNSEYHQNISFGNQYTAMKVKVAEAETLLSDVKNLGSFAVTAEIPAFYLQIKPPLSAGKTPIISLFAELNMKKFFQQHFMNTS